MLKLAKAASVSVVGVAFFGAVCITNTAYAFADPVYPGGSSNSNSQNDPDGSYSGNNGGNNQNSGSQDSPPVSPFGQQSNPLPFLSSYTPGNQQGSDDSGN